MIKITSGLVHIEQVKQLITEYLTELDIDLTFQHVDQELADLATTYQLPLGRLYIAFDDEIPVGCVGLKPLNSQSGEVKRLYVKPSYRKQHIANLLMTKLLEEAKLIGYQQLYLDTLASLTQAVALYQKFGFKEIPPYYDNPLDHVIYFKLEIN